MISRVHIFGAPGSGVTTLGKALSDRLGFSHFDTDDYYWFTDDALPYRRKRNPDHRRQVLKKDLESTGTWVLSGSLCGWGDVFIPSFDLVVFMWLPAEIRLRRIQEREFQRYGADRLLPGGDLNLVYEKFRGWAATYDEESGNIRSKSKEEQWLEQLTCPVLKMKEPESTDAMVTSLLASCRFAPDHR